MGDDGGFSSSTRIVMMTAKTPSENALRRSRFGALSDMAISCRSAYSRSAFDEGIENRQFTDRATVLHILAVERVAAGLGGSCDDESIVEG